ncbi:Transcription initiation factor TFIID subunit 12 [Hyphodiscus hymeniophilus]|uniref:Transcription initiation factor TFIID subunit 12 n=1 Tax=Hyphodiscus hymeniophilus TaxID=353542 RepID=A0A9P6VFQ7_9HELO|nr:Transcription initiation factor TFIID subunit 12 [Hyphodiscus hymeniophilus]
MNNPAQGQAGPGQPSGQQAPKPPHIFRPDQMRQLPDKFTAEEKQKWEQGLKQLYAQIETHPKESQPHQEAKRKLLEFSRTLTNKIQAFRVQQAQQAQQGGDGRPQSQGQSQSQGETSGQDSNAAQQPRPQPKISAKILEHINKFPYVIPTTLSTPEAAKWIQDAKQRYAKGLVAMESSAGRIASIDAFIKRRNDEGKPLSAEEEKNYGETKAAAERQHSEASKFVENFRASQKQQQVANQQNGSQQAGNSNQNGTPTPTRPNLNIQQPSNPALQNTQAINAAMEAARNQQMGGPRPSVSQQGLPQLPGQNGPHSNIPQHQNSQVQNIKQEAGVGVPQINTSVNQQRPMNNSPQSAIPQSAGPQSATAQIPRALTHPQALQTAARSYSNAQITGTPNVMGHSHPHPPAPRETSNVMTNKMPIPKHLPERATAQPQPVTMVQSRPTLSGGPSNSGNGVIGQPVLQRQPGYNLDADDGRVLNKKKLDELVRQVTGGGEGLGGGEALTPDVEESILNVADDFVDQVLQAACKNAKERGSRVLEIRDIQLTLERGYNIRIPGYASDEIRTVRKIQPAPAWISKMSAVQAAKVTGGKNAD